MSRNTSHEFLSADLLVSTQVGATEKRSLLQKYLQNPFSIVWSNLAALFQATPSSESKALESDQSKQQEPDSIREQDLYPHFTDRVDPSLYYTIFFPHKHF